MGSERYTVDELAEVTGHSVRNIRYYTGLGLVPSPTREGRIAVYGAEHRARLELISALAEHGFTLEAIGRYLERRGVGASVEDLAMQRALITSWTSDSPEDIQARIGRELRALGLPRDALEASHEATTRHMAALAGELDRIFHDQIVDVFRAGTEAVRAADEERDDALVHLRELTVEAVVVAFQEAMNDVVVRSWGGREVER